jgi:hypothetical protein
MGCVFLTTVFVTKRGSQLLMSWILIKLKNTFILKVHCYQIVQGKKSQKQTKCGAALWMYLHALIPLCIKSRLLILGSKLLITLCAVCAYPACLQCYVLKDVCLGIFFYDVFTCDGHGSSELIILNCHFQQYSWCGADSVFICSVVILANVIYMNCCCS